MYLRLALQASAGLKKYWDSPPFHVGTCIYFFMRAPVLFALAIKQLRTKMSILRFIAWEPINR